MAAGSAGLGAPAAGGLARRRRQGRRLGRGRRRCHRDALQFPGQGADLGDQGRRPHEGEPAQAALRRPAGPIDHRHQLLDAVHPARMAGDQQPPAAVQGRDGDAQLHILQERHHAGGIHMPQVEDAGHDRIADRDGRGVAVDELRLALERFLQGHHRHEVLPLVDHRQTQEIQHRLQQGVQMLDFHLPVQFALELQRHRLVGDLLGIVDIVQAHMLAHQIQQLEQRDRLGQGHRQHVLAIGGDRLIRRGPRRSRRRPRAGGRETDPDGLGRRVGVFRRVRRWAGRPVGGVRIGRRRHLRQRHNLRSPRLGRPRLLLPDVLRTGGRAVARLGRSSPLDQCREQPRRPGRKPRGSS